MGGLYRDYIGVILGLYWGYIGIMEKKMETIIMGRLWVYFAACRALVGGLGIFRFGVISGLGLEALEFKV